MKLKQHRRRTNARRLTAHQRAVRSINAMLRRWTAASHLDGLFHPRPITESAGAMIAFRRWSPDPGRTPSLGGAL